MLMLQTRCFLIYRWRNFHSQFPCCAACRPVESTGEPLFSVSRRRDQLKTLFSRNVTNWSESRSRVEKHRWPHFALWSQRTKARCADVPGPCWPRRCLLASSSWYYTVPLGSSCSLYSKHSCVSQATEKVSRFDGIANSGNCQNTTRHANYTATKWTKPCFQFTL